MSHPQQNRQKKTRDLLDAHPELAIERDEYNINVTSNDGSRIAPSELMRLYRDFDGAGKPAHLYFHVPLCNYICHFCSYVKRKLPAGAEGERSLDEWVERLIAESAASARLAPWTRQARIESLYLGGGTAALFKPRHLKRLLDHVRETYTLSENCEISLEGNPDNFSAQAIEDARALGFNRFSIGIQSLQDPVTRFTGRGHDRAMSLESLKALKATGLPFNADIMFGLPHQTPENVESDIRELLDLGVPTITIYRLRNSDRQSMGIGNRAAWGVPSVLERLNREKLFPSLEETYEMRDRIVALFLERGYHPSPCGWWSKPGTYAGQGNIPQVSRNKWQNYDTMLAFGPGAYGWLTGGGKTVLQYHHVTDISAYAKAIAERPDEIPFSYGRVLENERAVAATLGFNFKSNQPISLERYRAQFGVDLLEDEGYAEVFYELIDKGLIEANEDGSALLPTLDGEALHEELISTYFHGRIGGQREAVCLRQVPARIAAPVEEEAVAL